MGRHSKPKPVRRSSVPRFVVGATMLATTTTITGPIVAPTLAHADSDTDWNAVAKCESGGNPAATDHSGQHLGMYQFTRSTWAANGGHGDPRNASSAEQTRVAENVKRTQGMGAWPVCGRHAYDSGSRQVRPVVDKTSITPAPKHEAPRPTVPAPVMPRPSVMAMQPDVLMGPALYPGGEVRTVQPGDCLASIAGDRWQQVAELNHIQGPDYLIYPGQTLVME
jgi:resuscitation-promoting factor RpfA